MVNPQRLQGTTCEMVSRVLTKMFPGANLCPHQAGAFCFSMVQELPNSSCGDLSREGKPSHCQQRLSNIRSIFFSLVLLQIAADRCSAHQGGPGSAPRQGSPARSPTNCQHQTSNPRQGATPNQFHQPPLKGWQRGVLLSTAMIPSPDRLA